MDFENFDTEIHGEAVLAEMARATRARTPGGFDVQQALEHAGTYLYLARAQVPAGAHEPAIVVQVASRLRTLKYAAA